MPPETTTLITSDSPSGEGANKDGSAAPGADDKSKDTGTLLADDKGEGKPDGSKDDGKTGTGDPAKSKDNASAALEIKLPDGVAVDKETLAWFGEAAKDSGLNSEQASKLAAGFAKYNQLQSEKLRAEVQEWEKSLASDPEVGGAKWAENLQTGKTAVKRFATPGFINLLNETGLGSHPDVVRTFVAVGRAIREDTTGSRSTGSPPMTERELNDMRFPTSKNVGR